MIDNPLARLTAGTSTPESVGPVTNFAVVTAVSPALKIRLAGDDDPLEGSPPVSLVSGLKVGHVVRVEFNGRQLIITGSVDGTPTDLAKRADLPPWRTPALLNGWEHYTSFGYLQYRRIGDEVQFKGTVRLGSGIGSSLPLFYVEPDCAPPNNILHRGHNNTSLVDLRFTSAGAVYVQAPAAATSWTSFEGIRYFTT